ncbi:replicative DNA helicase [Carboxydocella sp. ULO1]|uniref:replicative DNA helicase n=1 Tax=Carboxydocella sp. ULO1 TaxID=1926599 RepID=UPI0009AD2FA2|nr:replicative DNA helicase [Carboxydocella sp. ULO1]GAW28976.1 replicative DNA helicase [Carboxydocella sp. ULO1]
MRQTLPSNIDAEQSVLGAMILAEEAILEVQPLLAKKDFYNAAHGEIYEAIITLHEARIPVDLVTLGEELTKNGKLERVGGFAYLATLTNQLPSVANARYYAEIVREKSIARQLIRLSDIVKAKAISSDYEDINELIHEAERDIFGLSVSVKNTSGLTSAWEVTHRAMDDILERKPRNGVTGLPTGFYDLDAMTAGLHPNQLIVVAARPAMGKTSFAVQIAINNVLKPKKRVAFFSLETSKEKIVEKMIVNIAKVDAQAVRLGLLDETANKKIIDAAGLVSQSGLMLDDTPDISVPEILSRCRKAKLEQGLDLVIIDYIQLIKPTGKGRETREREVSEITRGLKLMAMELKTPVLALSQLSRAVEHTQDKRPSLSHLRESGAIEQDADVVLFLYRPEYYFPDTNKKGIAEIIVAKQREGPVGTVEVKFDKYCTRFYNLEKG